MVLLVTFPADVTVFARPAVCKINHVLHVDGQKFQTSPVLLRRCDQLDREIMREMSNSKRLSTTKIERPYLYTRFRQVMNTGHERLH